MSPGALTLEQVQSGGGGFAPVVAGPSAVGEPVEVSLEVEPEVKGGTDLVWRQVNEILRSSSRSFASQRSLEQTSTPTPEVPLTKWRTVAPGVIVSRDEYEERYGCLDLERYRQAMSPDVFEAFVRFIGGIPGRPDVDIVEITSMPEK